MAKSHGIKCDNFIKKELAVAVAMAGTEDFMDYPELYNLGSKGRGELFIIEKKRLSKYPKKVNGYSIILVKSLNRTLFTF